MDKLKLKFQNCYGIKKLEKEFDFSTVRTTYAIYAPNGAMKTSFAKSFEDLQLGSPSKDLIFPTRKTVREIIKEDGSELLPEEVFVVLPYREDFSSEKMSTLLVNKELKEKYDAIHIKIDEQKNNLTKELKRLSGLRDDVEKEISETFLMRGGDSVLVALESAQGRVLDKTEPTFVDISYKEIFNEKALTFLETKDFKKKVADYIKKYDELIAASKYFKKGVFNHNNAAAVAKSLMDNGFFAAEHSVSLHDSHGDNKISTKEELERVIEEEKNAILKNPELVKAFEDIDKALNKNEDLRKFRDYLVSNEKIIVELENLGSFRQKIWISYLKDQKEFYSSFLKEYQIGKSELDRIAEKAKTEKTDWLKVIDIFNKRFSVPFKLVVKNQDDVILRAEVPSIDFIFKDPDGEVSVEKNNLLQALSSGEKRALYILNIIFEVEARKEEHQDTLFIVDDIADSFDYKNKYAIIEYLKEISEQAGFYQIILTHNFDFFRTIQGRLSLSRDGYCLMVEKTNDEVKLINAEYLKPFEYWMKHLEDDKTLIASIPFTRNIIEYTRGKSDPDYVKLTSILHIKSDSQVITKKDIADIYKHIFPNQSALILKDETAIVMDLIFSLADGCLSDSIGINLENKILLAVAIRLKAEKYMFNKLTDKSEPPSYQTRTLFDRFKTEFSAEKSEAIKTLDQVNLMTPENIHFNSFMYEPILDMSDEHLRSLYKRVKDLS